MIEYSRLNHKGCDIESALFRTSDGTSEYHLMFHPAASGSFDEQLGNIRAALKAFIDQTPTPAVPVFMRWFLSDAANQQSILESRTQICATSIVEQPPLDGTKVNLWVWIAENADVCQDDDGMWTGRFAGASHLWSAGQRLTGGDSEQQTALMFKTYRDMLESRGCTLGDNCLRTWIYVHDIDNSYSGVVKGRREFFSQEGLTSKTHFIASTGIAGRVADASAHVIMDTYGVKGIAQEQVKFLKGATHLNPTHEYGVTFERGTAVDHPDRIHVFISGTASINNKGEIVHEGDITGQTLRMIENVLVLLDEGGCTKDDIMQMTVYLRDIADCRCVSGLIEKHFPDQPKTILWAPVCRPGWLVEMECIAVKKK